jgi:hypothetical protein
MTGTVWVSGGSHHTGHPGLAAAATGEHSPVSRISMPVAELFPSYPWIFVTMIIPVVVRTRELAKQELFASWPFPRVFRMIELGVRPYLRNPFLCLGYDVSQLFVCLTKKDSFPSGSEPLADKHAERHQKAVGFSASSGSFEEYLKYGRGRQERLLASWLRFPYYVFGEGLDIHGLRGSPDTQSMQPENLSEPQAFFLCHRRRDDTLFRIVSLIKNDNELLGIALTGNLENLVGL